MNKYYYCIDVGGTDIKGGIVDETYKIICLDKMSSSQIKNNEDLKFSVLNLMYILQEKSGLTISDASGLGIAFPGLVDGNFGIVKHLSNLNVSNYDIISELKKDIDIPIKIANDAELALIAEHKLGAGKGYNNIAMITLGTGVGLGLVVNGINLRSVLPYSSEYGHNKINLNGDELETLVSTKALTEQIKSAMRENPNSLMWQKYTFETASAKTVFDFKDEDGVAKKVFDTFISNLGRAIVNLFNVFTPELIVVGGGISKQGTNLTTPLENYVNKNILLHNIGIQSKIVPAKYLNEAGVLGARCLFD